MIEDLFVSGHALDRLREHYPNIGVRGALLLLDRAQALQPEVAASVLCRKLDACQDTYMLADDYRGIFVVAGFKLKHERLRDPPQGKVPYRYSLVTYLRLSPSQADTLRGVYTGSAEAHG